MKWATERGKKKNLEAYECVDLDKTLSQFYAEVRKESGESDESCKQPWSDTLSQNCTRNLLSKIKEFLSSRKVLQGKARKLREEGRGKRPNRSKSLKMISSPYCAVSEPFVYYKRCYSLRTTCLIFETLQILFSTASLIFTTELFHEVI